MRQTCWTCKYFTYLLSDAHYGWCRRLPPVRDIQRDAALAPISGCVEVSTDGWCGKWETDRATRKRVKCEADSVRLQNAYYTLASIDYAIGRFQTRIDSTDSIAELESIECEIDHFLQDIERAKETVRELGENPYMASCARTKMKEAYGYE